MIVNLALMSGFLIIFAVTNEELGSELARLRASLEELGLTNNKESSRLWLKQLI